MRNNLVHLVGYPTRRDFADMPNLFYFFIFLYLLCFCDQEGWRAYRVSSFEAKWGEENLI